MIKCPRKEPEKTNPHMSLEKFKCYTCGKQGHTSKYCRLNRPVTESPERKPVVCYNCREIGHKAPACPKPKTEKPRKKEIKLLKEQKPKIKELQENEILVKVAGKDVPVTLDSGATITVLPKEIVPSTWLTGRQIAGKGFGIDHNVTIEEAHLSIQVAGKKMTTMGRVVPSKQINGTGVLSYRSTTNTKDLSFPKLLEKAIAREDDDRLYLDYNDPSQETQGVVTDSVYGEEEVINVEEKELGFMEDILATEEEPSVDVAVEGDQGDSADRNVAGKSDDEKDISGEEQTVATEENTQEGIAVGDEINDEMTTPDCDATATVESTTSCANKEGDNETPTLQITSPKYSENNSKLREDTVTDTSLNTMRELANKEKQGYSWKAGLIIRRCLDDLGRVKTQICLPTSQRQHVMTLAHEKFGHLSRNLVVQHITKSFYWPTLWKDVRLHVQSCDTCQRITKKNPKKAPMIKREIVTVPFERVSIDLVGPLPKSRGGFQYLFTYIDNASRWPEAEPLRTITAKAVTKAFETICLRNGFPRVVISDNGTQFCSKEFKHFCEQHNIQAVRTSPYRPQSNGLVERMHATLTGMINKLSRSKQGVWNDITKLALYFMRMTPSSATGFSPYMVVHGWEPASPLEVVKEGLLDQNIKDMDITTWVKENMERIETVADHVVDRQTAVTTQRKKDRDKYSKQRTIDPGTQVLYRTPGMNAKLTDAWEGPYEIEKQLGPVTYSMIVNGDKKKRIAHVNTLKEYNERKIKKVTTILEEDKSDDDITGTNDKLKIIHQNMEADRKADIESLQQQFSETLREEPGVTELAIFTINTGDARPIAQRLYMTAEKLKKGVEEELSWLLQRGFIEESCGEWASPIVTVKKPNGKIRICVDFRKVNEVTTPIPFYMPCIEEVLEATGQASVISKTDLSKGYYQVVVHPEDRDKTTFVCHSGKFRFTRMPFGVCNAPAVFQTLMNKVVKGLEAFCRVYMDDLIIYSNSWTEHMTHVKQVHRALKVAGLTANPSKCEWGGQELQFLGHVIGSGNISIPEREQKR